MMYKEKIHDNIISINKTALEHYNYIFPEVSNFCTPLCLYFGIKVFMWIRIYKSGKYLHISNAPKLSECAIKNLTKTTIFFQDYIKIIDKQNDYDCVLWPRLPENFAMQMCMDFGYWHGISLIPVQHTDEFIEMSCFLGDIDNSNIGFYSRNISILESFTDLFRKKFNNEINIKSQNNSQLGIFADGVDLYIPNRQLIQKIEHDRIKNFYKAIELSPKTKIRFSIRETECLKLLCQGYSIKEIARIKSINPRTVETYLNRVKDKTGIRYKSELVRFYYE